MMKLGLVFAALLLTAPLAARAEIGLRLGGEASIARHSDLTGTQVITDNWPVGLDAMLSWWLPGEVLSFDLEIGEQFYLSSPPSGDSRIGTVFRPGVRLSPPILPLYFRAAVPINFEQPSSYPRETYDLRLGAGFTIPLVLFKIFIEGDADFPLGGGSNAPNAFSQWNLLLNAGLDFRF
jgi:hypothetical protein